MKNQDKQPGKWREHVRCLIQVAEEAMRTARRLERQAGESSKVQASLRSLSKQLEEIGNSANNIYQISCIGPAEKVLAGRLMTEQEYFFLRASGCHMFTAKGLGLGQVDDYEVHRNLCYKDDEKYCYINPAAKPQDPDSKEAPWRIGLPPEELNLKDLRAEQRRFFEKHLPDVLQRFKTD